MVSTDLPHHGGDRGSLPGPSGSPCREYSHFLCVLWASVVLAVVPSQDSGSSLGRLLGLPNTLPDRGEWFLL